MQRRFERRRRDTGRMAIVVLALGTPVAAYAEVNININVGPPPVIYAEPPELVVVPQSRAYFVPGLSIDLFFSDGYWWSPRGQRWYRARDYNGPWDVMERRYVPRALIRLPRDYREVYVREKHIPYGQWKKQWKHWDKEERKEWSEEEKWHKKGHHHKRREDDQDDD